NILIISTIGAGVDNDYKVDDYNYDKIIIIIDAHSDDSPTHVLLLTFFFNYMRPLFEAGKIYIALTTLFKLETKGKKKKIKYVWTEDELADAQKEMGSNAELQRY